MKVLIIGSGGREHAIARALTVSVHQPELYCFGQSRNPGIMSLTRVYELGSVTDVMAILDFAGQEKIDWAIIGPEAPLEVGLADALELKGIPCLGPKRALAQIETSKSFARDLLRRYAIPGQPKYQIFTTMAGVLPFLQGLGENHFVIKADGLMSGKGVKVAGDHLKNYSEALEYCRFLLDHSSRFVIEERLIGQEFSLMSFSDGRTMAHMPLVQDYKRVYEGDQGPNTGGMGSYTMPDHSLPFLSADDVRQAHIINESVIVALRQEFGEGYRGILYGGFMVTAAGVRVIEFNARFGDPEAINVLALLATDFVDICLAIIQEKLSARSLTFTAQATVCKYLVPQGYPDNPLRDQEIHFSSGFSREHIFYAGIDERAGRLYASGSRALAVLGKGATLEAAEKEAETQTQMVQGPLFHRHDIATARSIAERMEMIEALGHHYDLESSRYIDSGQ